MHGAHPHTNTAQMSNMMETHSVNITGAGNGASGVKYMLAAPGFTTLNSLLAKSLQKQNRISTFEVPHRSYFAVACNVISVLQIRITESAAEVLKIVFQVVFSFTINI